MTPSNLPDPKSLHPCLTPACLPAGGGETEEGRSLCNHRRSYRFFIDSISPNCTFPASPCDSYESLLAGECFPCGPNIPCGQMGYYADRFSARGKLYLITREDEPFCGEMGCWDRMGKGGEAA